MGYWKESFVSTKPLVFLACVILLTAWVLRSGGGRDSLIRKGSKAPDFTLTTEEGQRVSLGDFRGSVVFLNFWRTDCAPCAAEMPDMETVARLFKGRKFHMMPVSLDMDTSEVSRFYREHNLTIPAYLDPGQNVASRYNILATPETLIIDSEVTVAQYYIGAQKWASPEMLAQLDQVIP
jgi:peroxiredoxin